MMSVCIYVSEWNSFVCYMYLNLHNVHGLGSWDFTIKSDKLLLNTYREVQTSLLPHMNNHITLIYYHSKMCAYIML